MFVKNKLEHDTAIMYQEKKQQYPFLFIFKDVRLARNAKSEISEQGITASEIIPYGNMYAILTEQFPDIKINPNKSDVFVFYSKRASLDVLEDETVLSILAGE